MIILSITHAALEYYVIFVQINVYTKDIFVAPP